MAGSADAIDRLDPSPIVLRSATDDDRPLFARWFAEMRGLDALPDDLRATLVDQQLDLQFRSYAAAYPGLDRFAITFEGRTVGRLDRWEDEDQVRVVEFVIEPAERGRGLGTTTLRAVLDHAADRRTTLSVEASNTVARRLYERLGFRPATGEHHPDEALIEMVHP